MLCRKLEPFTQVFVALEGGKFKAMNNRDKNFTKAKLKCRLQQIDEGIERYLGQMAGAEGREAAVVREKTQRLEDKVIALNKEMARLKRPEVRMVKAPDRQISLTDPDAQRQDLDQSGEHGGYRHPYPEESQCAVGEPDMHPLGNRL